LWSVFGLIKQVYNFFQGPNVIYNSGFHRIAGRGVGKTNPSIIAPASSNRLPDFNCRSKLRPMLVKNLHTVSALIELGAGLALLVAPSIAIRLLLGSEISGPVVPLGRVAGAALLALGVACWLASGETKSRAARGLVVAMLVYNFGAVIVLGAAGLQLQTVGIVLWPAVILHAVMAVWCVRVLIGLGKNVPH
jgi:hypothetical protein